MEEENPPGPQDARDLAKDGAGVLQMLQDVFREAQRHTIVRERQASEVGYYRGVNG